MSTKKNSRTFWFQAFFFFFAFTGYFHGWNYTKQQNNYAIPIPAAIIYLLRSAWHQPRGYGRGCRIISGVFYPYSPIFQYSIYDYTGHYSGLAAHFTSWCHSQFRKHINFLESCGVATDKRKKCLNILNSYVLNVRSVQACCFMSNSRTLNYGIFHEVNNFLTPYWKY